MKVNGKSLALTGMMTLSEFLMKTGYEIPKIAVERNGKVIPKREYEKVELHDDDTLEIIAFMGGG